MRLEALLYLYGRRLRSHPVQELLAGMGIAIGVALALAVMVANGSVVRSSDEIVHAVIGSANLQLAARDPAGFDASMLAKVRALPGVEHAAPLMEQRAVVAASNGHNAGVTLASVDPSLAKLSGRLPANLMDAGLFVHGVVLPTATARALGLPSLTDTQSRPLPTVSLSVRGHAFSVSVSVLGPDTLGVLANARVALLPLARLQALAGLPGRITRILVETKPGRAEEVRRQLSVLANGRLTVERADVETQLLRGALGPSGQATAFFAAISALIGFLLAFNAMLLTAPERRRMIFDMRVQGVKARQLVVLMMFQSAVLGTVASTVGLLAGNTLARVVFDQSPAYLSPPFTLGSRTIVGVAPILLALVGGVAASCLASVPPLLDLRRGRAVDAIFHSSGAPGNTLSTHVRTQLLMGAMASLVVAGLVLVAVPSAALVASAGLALATVLAIPTVFAIVLQAAGLLARRAQRAGMLHVALLTLRATTLRSLALAATGAVAVYGCVAIGGARADLLRGIESYTADYVGTADIWIVNRNDNQATNDFRAGQLSEQIAKLPGIAAVRQYQGGFLDTPGRRVWVIARPSGDGTILPPSQIVHGDLVQATARLRSGGWIAVSDQIARQHGVALGDMLTWPTPTGSRSFRVAATMTNLGWSPGALILNRTDYRSAWQTSTPTALEVDVSPGTSLGVAQRRIQSVVDPRAGLLVQTAAERAHGINASAQQGLSRLSQISVLLLIAAVLAMAAAMGAAIWQRRTALAALRMQSFSPRQLLRVLMLEAGIVLGAGCLTGAIIGVYGQVGADRFLNVVTGFPVAPAPAGWQTLQTSLIVVATSLLVVAIPGWFAARVPPHLGLQE